MDSIPSAQVSPPLQAHFLSVQRERVAPMSATHRRMMLLTLILALVFLLGPLLLLAWSHTVTSCLSLSSGELCRSIWVSTPVAQQCTRQLMMGSLKSSAACVI